jgi:DNA invertase Pin-like site-specific DNA recombinase
MLGVFAEFETNLRRERQMEGIGAAKKRGVYKGRPRSIDAAKITQLMSEGMGATAVAKKLGIGRASVYRVLRQPGIKVLRRFARSTAASCGRATLH